MVTPTGICTCIEQNMLTDGTMNHKNILLMNSQTMFHFISSECGFTCKWTLLCNPDQLSRGSQGFLKFSIRILMPGEKQITSSLYRNFELVNKES